MQTSISCCMLAGGQVVGQVGQVRQVGRLAGEAGSTGEGGGQVGQMRGGDGSGSLPLGKTTPGSSRSP